MEENEGFKHISRKIEALKQQLLVCDENFKAMEQYGKEAEKEIEEHFEKCMSALASRKALLKSECMVQVHNYSMSPLFLPSSFCFIYT